MSARRRSPIARRSPAALKSTISTKSRPAAPGSFARVKIRFEPMPPGSGFVFENSVVGGNVPKEYVPGVEKGLRASTENGVLAGFRSSI